MRYLIAIIMAISIPLSANAATITIDPAEYFAHKQGLGNSHLFLSKQPCPITKDKEVLDNFKTKIEQYCSVIGGTPCPQPSKSFSLGWKKAMIADSGMLTGACWKEVKIEGVKQVALCNQFPWYNCSIEYKKSFVSTDSLPSAPPRPKAADFNR